MTQSDSLKITAQNAELLKKTLLFQAEIPIEHLTQFAVQSPEFCDQMLGILFPRRRPPTITPPVIQQCVRQLGVERARLLFVTSIIIKMFKDVSCPQFDKDRFWQDSLRRGCAAQVIAEKLSYENPYEAFVASFLAELGTLLIASRMEHISPILSKLRTRISNIRVQNEELLTGKTHAEEISTTGLASLLPPRILQSIVDHHTPFPLHNRQAKLTCILYAADAIGDIAQSYPKNTAIIQAEEALIMLLELQDAPLNLEGIFAATETSASLLGQDLGLDTDLTLDYSTLLKMDQLIELLDYQQPEFQPIAQKDFETQKVFFHHLKKVQNQGTDPYSLLVLNLDHFKQINVGYGFPTGDNLLKLLQDKILRSMRSSDHIFHLGKDEFIFLLPKTSTTGGRIVGERLRALIKSVYLTIGMQRIGCTASIGGITIQRPIEQSWEGIWPQVRTQLLDAKSKGRNRVSWRLPAK